MAREAFHPSTIRMLRAAQGLQSSVDPAGVAAFRPLLSHLFTARVEQGLMRLDSCGRETARLLGPEASGLDLLARFPRSDRAALRLLLGVAEREQRALVAGVLARRPDRAAIRAELTLAPLLRRSDGSAAVLGLLQPLRFGWPGPALELRVASLHLDPPAIRPQMRLVVG